MNFFVFLTAFDVYRKLAPTMALPSHEGRMLSGQRILHSFTFITMWQCKNFLLVTVDSVAGRTATDAPSRVYQT